MKNDANFEDSDIPLIRGVAELSEADLEEIEVIPESERQKDNVIRLSDRRNAGVSAMYSDFHKGCIAGLNGWASQLVSRRRFKYWRRTFDQYPDGRTIEVGSPVQIFEDMAKKEESGSFFPGIDGSPVPLHKYVFLDGDVYYEYLQECSETGHPVFFLALRFANGRAVLESVWTREEMERAIREL